MDLPGGSWASHSLTTSGEQLLYASQDPWRKGSTKTMKWECALFLSQLRMRAFLDKFLLQKTWARQCKFSVLKTLGSAASPPAEFGMGSSTSLFQVLVPEILPPALGNFDHRQLYAADHQSGVCIRSPPPNENPAQFQNSTSLFSIVDQNNKRCK